MSFDIKGALEETANECDGCGSTGKPTRKALLNVRFEDVETEGWILNICDDCRPHGPRHSFISKDRRHDARV